MSNYNDLLAYKAARKVAKAIYLHAQSFPQFEKFALADQLRRAAVSIFSNIAEGCGRGTNKDFAHFLEMSRGSLQETESQFDFAVELGFCDDSDEVRQDITECGKLINGLIKHLKASH